VTQLAVFVEMRFKNGFSCPRPLEWSPQVQPMLTTPGHGTFPMGHATQVFAVGHVLKQLIRFSVGRLPPNLAAQIDRLSFRISENRIVAGLHFPADLLAGAYLGITLGRHALFRMGGRVASRQPRV
jgi:membrane-associated phospholipid phosphatase